MAEILSTVSVDGLKGTPTNGGDRYTTLALWESDQQQDLVAGGDTAVVECYGDDYGGLNGALDGSLQISGWTSNLTTNTITVRPAVGSEHGGVSRARGGTGFAITTGGSRTVESHHPVYIQGIEILNTGAGNSVTASGGAPAPVLDRLICTAGSGRAVQFDTASADYVIRNSLCEAAGWVINVRNGNGVNSALIEGCTAISNNGQFGIVSSAGDTVINNTVAIGSTDDDFRIAPTGSNNASMDSTAVTHGIGTVTGVTNADADDFTQPSTDDYSVYSGGGSVLEDGGAYIAETDPDIAGNARGNPVCEIGAYEIVSGTPAPVITLQPLPDTVTEPDPASMTTAATGATSSQWRKGTPPGGVDVSGETGDTINWNPSAVADSGDYYNRYTGAGGDTDTNAATLTVNPGVTPPSGVDAGGPYSGDVDTAIQLAGSFTPGSDPTPVLTWSIDSGGTGTFLPNANAEDPTFTPDQVGPYTLRFSVNPSDGSPVEDTATLTSNAVAPTVDAGGPYNGVVSTPIALDATVTPGSDPSPTLLWTEVTALGGTFSNDAIEDPTFTPSQVGAYTLRLSADPSDGSPVTNDAGLTSSGAPVAPSDVDAGGPYLNSEIDTAVQLNGGFTPGTGSPDVILWTTDEPGGVFSDDSIKDPTYTSAALGTWTLTLDVSNATGSDSDPATFTTIDRVNFDGSISNIIGTVGVAITPIDVSGEFSGSETPFAYSETGTPWPNNGPSPADINSTTGIITWTPDVLDVGSTTGCTVTATDQTPANVASNNFSFIASLPAPPTIDIQPQPQTEPEGENATFTVAASGTGPLTYQWFDEAAQDVAGATSPTYVRSVVLADDGKSFGCKVTDIYNQTTASNLALLTVQQIVLFSGTIPNQNAQIGVLYNQDITSFFSGDLTPLTYTATGLPSGLSIGLNDGIITGTPDTLEAPIVVVTAEDTGAYTADSNGFTITVNAAAVPIDFPGSVADQSTEQNSPFSLDVGSGFTGSETPFTYNLQAGTLPTGLNLNTSTGEISGTPSQVETQAGIIIRGTDTGLDTADTNAFEIDVTPEIIPVKTNGDIPDTSYALGTVVDFDITPYFTGTQVPFTYAVTQGALPSWATLNVNTGHITGTADESGIATLVITATDADTNSAASNIFDMTSFQINQSRRYRMNEGSGDQITEDGGENGTWNDALDWVPIADNSRVYRMNEGTGATLTDAIHPGDTNYEAVIQAYTDNWSTP